MPTYLWCQVFTHWVPGHALHQTIMTFDDLDLLWNDHTLFSFLQQITSRNASYRKDFKGTYYAWLSLHVYNYNDFFFTKNFINQQHKFFLLWTNMCNSWTLYYMYIILWNFDEVYLWPSQCHVLLSTKASYFTKNAHFCGFAGHSSGDIRIKLCYSLLIYSEKLLSWMLQFQNNDWKGHLIWIIKFILFFSLLDFGWVVLRIYLCHFYVISVISQLRSRRYPIL